jgi:hypothetical protein
MAKLTYFGVIINQVQDSGLQEATVYVDDM